MSPQTSPRSSGAPRPESLPSSDKASAKPIEMPAPIEAASPTRKAFQELWVAKAAAKTGASVDTEPSIRPTRPGWMICRTNRRRSFSASAPRAEVVEDLLLEPGGDLVVLLLFFGQVAEQLAGRSVAGAHQRPSIETRCGALHVARMRAHRVETQRPHLPDGLGGDIAADVLAPHQRNVVAEFRHEEIDQPAPVTVLLRRHLVEHFGACRIIVVQTIGEIGEDARVLLLVADGEGEDFAFGQIVELAHEPLPGFAPG